VHTEISMLQRVHFGKRIPTGQPEGMTTFAINPARDDP
jgi:hypothetical protein